MRCNYFNICLQVSKWSRRVCLLLTSLLRATHLNAAHLSSSFTFHKWCAMDMKHKSVCERIFKIPQRTSNWIIIIPQESLKMPADNVGRALKIPDSLNWPSVTWLKLLGSWRILKILFLVVIITGRLVITSCKLIERWKMLGFVRWLRN